MKYYVNYEVGESSGSGGERWLAGSGFRVAFDIRKAILHPVDGTSSPDFTTVVMRCLLAAPCRRASQSTSVSHE